MLPGQLSPETARQCAIYDHYMLVVAEKAVHTKFGVDTQIFAHNLHRHDLVDREMGFAQSFSGSISDLFLFPDWEIDLAKIIDIAEQFS
jgi:hypothetical protein